MIALITGASSGIGRDIAKYLAQYGYDLIVVAKSKNKLNEIYKDFKVKVKIIEADLTKKEEVLNLYNKVKDKKIDILINNAGFGDTGNFTETNLNKELEMIDLNIKAYHILTKLFLQDFVKRDYGRILNIASMAGLMPGPYMATYYSTKSYIINLSLSISEELKKEKSKVHISIFCPGPVETNFNKVANSKFNVKSISSEYASKVAIDNMFKNKLLIIPKNMKLNSILVKIIPNKILLDICSKIQERVSDK
jgi:hypothetical protein